MWYNVVKGVCYVPCCTFLLDKWILEKCSLPYSLLLDYSTFEFTTLPYPTQNWKTTTLQGLVMVFAVYRWALFQAKTEARSGAPLAALSQLHSSRFVQANYCWATSLEVWVVRHTNKAAWQRLTMMVHQQWGFIIRSPRWFNLRVTTSDSEISNLDIRPEFQSLQ